VSRDERKAEAGGEDGVEEIAGEGGVLQYHGAIVPWILFT
jgi:hypothetical protein